MAVTKGITKVEMVAKKLGSSDTKLIEPGTRCRVESAKHLGLYHFWFPNHYYVKVDASKVLDHIDYVVKSDGKT